MEDEKKTEQEILPTTKQTDKPLAVQVVNAVIDGAAAIAKSVIIDTGGRMGQKAEKSKVGKAADTLAKKAKRATTTASKKAAPKKVAAKKSASKKAALKKAVAKKVAAAKSKPAAKKTAMKRTPAKKTIKQSAGKATKKSTKKMAKKKR